jgi:3-hydroxyisobutyrate dehydrogenase-like beta-hydroxyacid dehydrogenase
MGVMLCLTVEAHISAQRLGLSSAQILSAESAVESLSSFIESTVQSMTTMMSITEQSKFHSVIS